MKFNKVLEEVLGKRSSVGILRVLDGADKELTGRQIAARAGLNHRSCSLSLEDLAQQGIVNKKPSGPAYLYTLKRENILVREGIVPLLKLEKDLVDIMVDSVLDVIEEYDRHGESPVLSVILFGDAAAGNEAPDSKLNLCIVAKDKDVKDNIANIFEPARAEIRNSFGNDLFLKILTVAELNDLYGKKDPAAMEIASSRFVWGEPTEGLLKAEAEAGQG